MQSELQNLPRKNDEEFLYDYWNHIPPVLNRPNYIYAKIEESAVRKIILFVLKAGILDDEGSPDSRKRHAISAKELLDIINSQLEKKVKLPNIYFHLDKLRNYDLIQPVVEMTSGRHKIKYFGRKAKLFLFNEGDEEDNKKKETLIALLAAINPEMTTSEIENEFNQLEDHFSIVMDKTGNWFETHSEALMKIDFDPIDLVNIFQVLNAKEVDEDAVLRMRKLFKME